MKRMLMLAALATALTTRAYEEFRTYSLIDGTSFNAAVIGCDSLEDAVELITIDGTLVDSPKTRFVETDQDYLTGWEKKEVFMSPTEFVIIPTRWTHRRWIGEEQADLPAEEEFALASGRSEYQYCLTLYNLSGVPLENLTVDYRISYRDSSESPESALHAVIPDDAAEETAYVSCSVEGAVEVPLLEAGKWKMYTTDSVSLSDVTASASSSRIRITVHMDTPDGSLTREVALPRS